MSFLKHGVLFILDIFAIVTLWRCSAYLVRQYLTKRTTILHDLPNLGRPRPDEKRIKGTAVVCGGSFAGLWSARVLSDHFEDVLVVDPETWLGTLEGCTPLYNSTGEPIKGNKQHPRSRVFQYNTTHAFQPIIYAILKMLYPSVDDEIRKMNGRTGNSDHCAHLFDTKLMRPPRGADGSCLQNLYLSRESFERLLRRLVVRCSPRIRWMVGTAKSVDTVQGDTNTLSSVTVRLPDNSEQTIPAALVVDCTGTTQAGLKWLKRIGAETDKTEGGRLALSDPDLRISYCTNQQTRTFYFPIPPEARKKLPIPGGYDNAKWLYTFTPVLGKGRKSVFVDRLEGHRMRIMVGTWGDLPLPTLDELRDFFEDFNPIQRLPEWLLVLIDALLEFKEHAEFVTSKYPVLSWIRYEKAAYVPSNFVAVGDSVMQVNPTFGQGCSKACVGAVALDSLLRSRDVINSTKIPAGFGARYFKEQAQKTAIAWEGTKPIDYLFPTTTPVKGEKLSDECVAAKLSTSMMLLSLTDEKINSVLFHACNFLGAPSELMHPAILAKVLFFWTRQRLGLAWKIPQD
ncbi:uncharacterized protein FOMMEDRAFT_134111 [Fomitiporia mediterranea MF3/22]|uniref:uncharacterized protein n=1 Tax=Fomitiporia mediterranea (strain MF3/22) TaxID=694068 RepID=UPI000440841A|nr:uncharacterized protein FOMMEDRAFT_134111 [Fomitiporia mediterranea MF3/22]EJD02944.1 hypothetical protein FOMMEDRAFT_134111 [Fomitiporia mediterranea MF3/22]